MIPWRQLVYGTLVLLGIGTGTAIYYHAPRQQVLQVDMAELYEGYAERLAAVSTTSSNAVSSVVTTQWTNDPSGFEYAVLNGTNAPTWTNYLVQAGTITNSVTNRVFDGSAAGIYAPFSMRVGMYARSGWSNFTANGFNEGFYTQYVTGLYAYAGCVAPCVIYTNANIPYDWGFGLFSISVLLDDGNTWSIQEYTYATNALGQRPALSEWSALNWNWGPRVNDRDVWVKPFQTSGAGSSTGCVYVIGNLYSNILSGSPATITESRWNAIGLQVSRTNLLALMTLTKNLIPLYLDHTAAYSNGFAAMAVTSVFSRLSIGNGTNAFSLQVPVSTVLTNIALGTNLTATITTNILTMGTNIYTRVLTNMTANSITNITTNTGLRIQVLTNDLREVERALAYLRDTKVTTHYSTTSVTWLAYIDDYYGDVTLALLSSYWLASTNGPGSLGIGADLQQWELGPGLWHLQASRSYGQFGYFSLLSSMATNLTYDIRAWYNTGPVSGDQLQFETGLITNQWVNWDSNMNVSVGSTSTFAVLAVTTNMPTNGFVYHTTFNVGYALPDPTIVLRWHFTTCTN